MVNVCIKRQLDKANIGTVVLIDILQHLSNAGGGKSCSRATICVALRPSAGSFHTYICIRIDLLRHSQAFTGEQGDRKGRLQIENRNLWNRFGVDLQTSECVC
jgi:hypothetical protein